MPDAHLSGIDARAETLIRIYAQADRELRKIIRDATARGAEGTAGYFNRQRRKVRAILRALERTNVEMIPSVLRDAYEPAARATDAVTGHLGEFEFAGPHEGAVAVMAAAMDQRLTGAVRTVGRSTDDVFRRIGTGEVAQGLARGDTRRATSMRMRQRLADEGLTAFVDRRGARWKLATYTRMVARTTTREAVTVATVNRLQDHDLDLVTISTHARSCAICLPFQGKTYSISGRNGRYGRIPQAAYPPIHPNCRHVLTPAAASFEEFERELGLSPSQREPPEPSSEATPEGGSGAGRATDRPGAPPASIRDAVNVAPLAERRLRPALDAIDDVHNVPAVMTERAIPMRSNPLREEGVFRATWLGEPMEIVVSSTARDEVASAVHELGHYFDKTVGTEGRFASQHAGALVFWRMAVERSSVVRGLRRSLETGRATVDGRDGRPINVNLDPEHIRFFEYLLSPEELWARSYMQWIGLRSGREVTLAPIPGAVADQWEPEDFEPIAQALDEYFRAKGLLK